MSKYIYLDNNATTKIDQRVFDAMLPYLKEEFANASSTHAFGVGVNEAVKIARHHISELMGCEPNEVIFTSGATEGINMAIKGVMESYASNGNHLITISTEHSAVLDTCKYLEKRGVEVTYLPVNENGQIQIESLEKAMRPDTVLVCAMAVNNETGGNDKH